MRRTAFLFLSLLLLSASFLVLSLNGCGRGPNISPPAVTTGLRIITPGKIEHVVILFQENRTPDNLFHDPALIANGADIASSGLNSSGQTIPLTPTALGIGYDLNHAHADFVAMYDAGKMDGANNIAVGCYVANCPPPNPQFMYVQASDVDPYFQLAEQYTFGDRMFSNQPGPQFPGPSVYSFRHIRPHRHQQSFRGRESRGRRGLHRGSRLIRRSDRSQR